MMFVEHLTTIHKCMQHSPNLIPAILLLKVLKSCINADSQVWLSQRFGNSEDTLNGFLMSMLIVHLVNIKKLNAGMGAYHVFKIALQYLGMKFCSIY
jgi:hypothetical protein